MHRALHADRDLARRVCDLLDLRHAAWVLDAVASPASELEAAARLAAASGEPAGAGRLWALLTDDRDPVRSLGRSLLRARRDAALAPADEEAPARRIRA